MNLPSSFANPGRAGALLLAVVCFQSVGAALSRVQDEPPGHPMPGFTRNVGPLRVDVGPTRVIAREARSPLVHQLSGGVLALTCGNSQVSTNIRSQDGLGQRWRPQSQYLGYLNSEELESSGALLVLDYDLRAVAGQPGSYQVSLFESTDLGLSLGSLGNGAVSLPTSIFLTNSLHWVNDLVELPSGTLLAAVQSLSNPQSTNNPWFSSLIRSTDDGRSWDYVSVMIDQSTIQDPTGALTQNGWPLYWATEPALAAFDENNLLCVARSANDEESGMPLTQVGSAAQDYHDLGNTLRGDELAPGLIDGIDSSKYYGLGPANAPLVASWSGDGGDTWSPAVPLGGAQGGPRGVFPRLAIDDNGLLALSYGGLSGVPRHGNAIAFSLDSGLTWTDEVNVGPFLTTGYTQLITQAPGHFIMFFDATPPQPWTADQRWWVGQVDIFVQPAASGPPFTKQRR